MIDKFVKIDNIYVKINLQINSHVIKMEVLIFLKTMYRSYVYFIVEISTYKLRGLDQK